jgi:hypothetical protein
MRHFADCDWYRGHPRIFGVRTGVRSIGVILAGLSAMLCGVAMAPARALAVAPAPHWKITADAWPTNFKPGDSGDVYAVYATNDGGRSTDGSTFTVSVSLPKSVAAVGFSGEARDVGSSETFNGNTSCHLETLTCTFERVEASAISPEAPGKLYPRSFIRMFVTVDVPNGPVEPVERFATVTGGGAGGASTPDPTKLSQASAAFGLSRFSTDITEVDGSPDIRAGSHPFEMTTSLAFNSNFFDSGEPVSLFTPKDINVSLPPGLIGDPNALPKCSQATVQSGGFEDCPADAQVGQLLVAVDGESLQVEPVYNIEPPPGQPAELGVGVAQFIHVPMFFHVRSDGDYGLTAKLNNLPEAGAIQESVLSLWGVPADPAHDNQRQGSGSCFSGCASQAPLRPFLTLPSSCSAEGTSNIDAVVDSWQNPGIHGEDGLANLADPNWMMSRTSLPRLTGCALLSFGPSIAVAPEVTQAEAPSGYTISLRVPQTDDPNVLATPNLKRAVVALPAGTVVSPSAANGLKGCSDEKFGLHSTPAANCPAASQIGRLKIASPLLSTPLEGQAFLGAPNCSPCSPSDAQEGRMIRLFLQAQGSGVSIKLAGAVSVDQSTGQLTTTFDNNPQLPFSELELVLNGGSRAPLANPATCGPATTTADLMPWSTPFTPDATPTSFFNVTGCGTSQFIPSFAAGTTNNQAGGFSPFVATVSRPDGNQALSGISVQTPPGLLGMLSRIPLCGEPQAAQGACPTASQIGHVITSAGPGPAPISLPEAGKAQAPVYLTGPYKGAPFGLAIVVPAEAGPLNLGTVFVRAAINVDPHTAQITVTSDPLPQQLDGIPIQIRAVSVAIDREGFIFNPTDCEPLSVHGVATSAQGTSVGLSNRFQSVNCGVLSFKPTFALSSQARTSKASGASLHVKVTSGTGQANIGKVKVDLPRRLPSRLTTLQKACLDSVFNVNPAACPAASLVGTATAHSPVLSVALTGPAYLVSHGGAAFPDLVIVLEGEGVTLELEGLTNISHGITSSTFRSVPDAPISTFELNLPEGPHSVLTANLPTGARGSLCGQSLVAPTAITGQNGAAIKQNTKIAVTGCPKHRKKISKKR